MKNTVKDLIEYLQKLPPDAKVETLVSTPTGYWFTEMDIEYESYLCYMEEDNTLEIGKADPDQYISE